MNGWTFLTNHAQVLLCISRDPDVRIRDIATTAGITERAAQHIVNDLAAAGYVSRTRVGNRNTYQIRAELPFRIPLMRHRQIGSLLRLLAEGAGDETAAPPTARNRAHFSIGGRVIER